MNNRITFFLLLLTLVVVAFYGCGSAPVEPDSDGTRAKSIEPGASTASTGDKVEPGPQKDPEAKVIYVRQRCIVIETEKFVLVFDPVEFKTRRQKTFVNGFVDVDQYRDSNMVVFVSSAARGRFYPGILSWKDRVKNIVYVADSRVTKQNPGFDTDGVHKAVAGEEMNLGDVKIVVIPTLEGNVAFLISVDGLKIYYSGDCAGLKNPTAKAIPGDEKIDIACHAFNSRGGLSGYKGLMEFAKKYGPQMLVPVIPGGNTWAIGELSKDVAKAVPALYVWNYRKMGESFKYPRSLPSGKDPEEK